MDQDLKDTIKKLEEVKKRQEKTERIVILLTGIFIVVIFSIIGINIYSGKEETVSEPEINIVAKEPPKQETPLKKEEENKKSEEQSKPVIEKKPEITQKTITENLEEQKKSQKTTQKKQLNKQKKTIIKEKKQPEKIISGYYIQVGAFSSLKKAEKLKKSLGLENVLVQKEGKLYKVLIGSFKNRKEAYDFLRKKNLKGFVKKL